ncbi:DMBT1-like protein [Mya arenaria]|uniref:DMBT1-like protein n=1 Tax=Mya arenaria TaxID=6604 RepID=A0ABY7DNH6_MYAAR|nr:DMBT1-like protein [Mya arenaria]
METFDLLVVVAMAVLVGDSRSFTADSGELFVVEVLTSGMHRQCVISSVTMGTHCDNISEHNSRTPLRPVVHDVRVSSPHRSPTYYRSYYIEGQGYGAIMIEDLQCRGGEWSLAQCDSGPWLSNNYCSHYDDVGVDCSANSPNCGGYFNGWSGYIASPNYPYQYDNNLRCTYHISVPSGHVRNFNSCSWNKLERYGDLLYRAHNDCSVNHGRVCRIGRV